MKMRSSSCSVVVSGDKTRQIQVPASRGFVLKFAHAIQRNLITSNERHKINFAAAMLIREENNYYQIVLSRFCTQIYLLNITRVKTLI